MIDYAKWKQTKKAVTTLLLDSRNPRLPPRSPSPSQTELIAELIRHEKVYDLAQRIVERGYYPVESPIAVEESGKLIVVEGNRRLAALKLLISPNLAPEKDRPRFKKLSHRASIGQIRRIQLLIAPDRDAAAPIIQSKHTRSEIESWSPVMQARFYADRVSDGSKVADLAREYFITPGEILDFLQNYHMYQIACNLDLLPEVAAKVNDPRAFPLTNLERIYRNKEASDCLGISFDANRQLRGTIDVEEFKKGFRRVVSDVALGKANSRNLNTSKEFEAYLKGLGADVPDKAKKGIFTGRDLLPGSPKGGTVPRNIQPPPTRPARPQRALISKAFVCGIDDVRINAVVRELKRISADEYPNAVALSLRALVDLTVGDYCDRLGATTKMIEKARAKDGKPHDWYPSVRPMLCYLIGDSQNLSLHPLALKAAKMLVADSSAVTILMLDAFAHNKFVTPTAAGLRSFWTQIEEAMKVMLAPNQSTTNA